MIRTIFYTYWCVLCCYTVIIKAYRFKYNYYYFLRIAHLRVYHKTHPIRKQFFKYGNILLGVHFNLRYLKLKSDY